ncbi:MAG: cation:proton antiporter [Candidatus Nanopelagicales bacterium]
MHFSEAAITGPTDLQVNLATLLILALVAAGVPLLVGILRLRVAEVVLLLGFGVIVGPQVLSLVTINDTIETFNELGLGLLFFLAGYELERESLQGRPGRMAIGGWVLSLVLALGVAAVLDGADIISDYLGVAICLTSTALGTLLPVLRDRGLLTTPFGNAFMGAGAAGEFGPILAIALLLGSRSILRTLVILVVFSLLVYMVARLPGRMMTQRVRELMDRGHTTSSQTAVRWTVLLLIGLLTLASFFGLDAVLGAFIAGVILRQYAPPSSYNRLMPKVEAIGFGFFIPLFFIVSGANLDVEAIIANPGRLVLFFVLLLVVRGVPQYFLYSRVLPEKRERWQFALYVATGLPILVAITGLQVDAGVMRPENAAALVGAGALSVLVFPLLGDWINRAALARLPEAEPGTEDDEAVGEVDAR